MTNDPFFQSTVVTDCIREIMEMQNQVLIFSHYADYATIEDQRNNLQLLRELMSKQKNMCFRCILSDSEDAKALLEEVLSHFEEFGHNIDRNNPMSVFAEVEENLNDLASDLDYVEKHGHYPGEDAGGETPPYQL